MKTVRIRKNIKNYLHDKPRNSVEIRDHINSTMRHGTTSQQLGNILSKDKDTFKLGKIIRSGMLSGDYEISEWGTTNWLIENQDPEDLCNIIYQPLSGSPITYILSSSNVQKLERCKLEEEKRINKEERKTLEELIV